MFTETLTELDDVLGIVCEGKLTENDLRRMHALLHARLATADRPGLVVDLTGFEGYEGIGALSEDLKMDTVHRSDLCRIAVVGEEKWIGWGTKFADALTKSEMRWFDANEANAAVSWARSS